MIKPWTRKCYNSTFLDPHKVETPNMNKLFQVITATLLILSASAWAAEDNATGEKLSLSASHSESLSAVVDAVNHETREVTLTGSKGNTITFTASPDVRNLDQVNVGDRVFAELYEEVNISVQAVNDAKPGAGQMQQISSAKKGDKPGAAVVGTTVVTATVEEINLENNTFKLKGPEGKVQQFTAENPENLKKAAVGDLVVITVTQALGIVVKAPEGE
jgi:hypothetical protein